MMTIPRKYALVAFTIAASFAVCLAVGIQGWVGLVCLFVAIYSTAKGIRILVRGEI